MNIKIIDDIISFFGSHSRSGTTTLIREIGEKHDVLILAADESSRQRDFKGNKQVATLTDIISRPARWIGFRKPIIIDNYTMIKLSEMMGDEIMKEKSIIHSLNKKIKKTEIELSYAKRELSFERIKNINNNELISKIGELIYNEDSINLIEQEITLNEFAEKAVGKLYLQSLWTK